MEKILIAEDDSSIRTGIKYLLLNEGYEITEADNGEIALKLVKEQPFDLILSDIMMPVKSGYELLEEIKKDETLASIPFVFLTAKTTYENYREGMNLGVDDYIAKPFNAAELLQSVKTRLKKKKDLEDRFEILKTGITKYIPHELRTPLVSILGYTDLILNDFKEETPAEIIDMVERINVAGNRLLRTIEKFLIFTQLKSEIKFSGSHHLDESCSDYSIARSIENTIQKLQKIYSNNISFESQIIERSINIPENYLRILLDELIDNAIKFSLANGIVKISTKEENDYYQIEITNNGREFTNDQIKKVSEFVQFDRDKFQQNGNGLGLSIVKSILTLVGGTLQINSKNNFSEVSVRIPLKGD
ncbi:MAG: response regulator [Bacteroidetes bacterium]|nr:response regulator [Bacteroidota bacterium]